MEGFRCRALDQTAAAWRNGAPGLFQRGLGGLPALDGIARSAAAGSTFACNASIDPRAAPRSRSSRPRFCRSSSSAPRVFFSEASAACRLLMSAACAAAAGSTFACNAVTDPRAAARSRARRQLFCRSFSSTCLVCASEATAACRLLADSSLQAVDLQPRQHQIVSRQPCFFSLLAEGMFLCRLGPHLVAGGVIGARQICGDGGGRGAISLPVNGVIGDRGHVGESEDCEEGSNERNGGNEPTNRLP